MSSTFITFEGSHVLLNKALAASNCIISVMGAHAGEDEYAIFYRKINDCKKVGFTFWVVKSAKARPSQVQAICNSGLGYVIFVEPASPEGVRPTTESDVATHYSLDRSIWIPIPKDMGPVTGQLNSSTTALVFDILTTDINHTIDLWNYADAAEPSKPLKFILGLSTVCAVRKDMSAHPQCMKSRYRRIVAIGRLVHPYCVWLSRMSCTATL